MTTEKPSAVNPVYVGPTWQRDPSHESGWYLPKRTIGWHAAAWASEWLLNDDGEPWRYTAEQLRLLLWWYAVDDNSRFLFKDGVIQRLKGWGKDPLGSTICAIEFIGPCRPDPAAEPFRDPWGCKHPAGKPHPAAWVQIAAVSLDQTQNTMELFPRLFSPAAVEEYELDPGKTIYYAHHGAQRLQAVTSSPATLEGARSTFILKNETHLWLPNNEGHKMDAVIRRNAAKAKRGQARSLAITNAYEPGEESVAEIAREAYEKVQAGQAVDTGMFYDSLEAPPEAKLTVEDAPAVIEAVKGDAVWLDMDHILGEIMDVRNPPSQSRRFWYNQIVAAEDAWVTPQEWDVLVDRTAKVAEGELISLGFDGSLTDDHSALIGCRIEDGFTFKLGVWNPEQHHGEAPRELIDARVREVCRFYDVVAFFSDLHPWESYVDAWERDFGKTLCASAGPKHRIAWDMRARQKEFTLEGVERLHNEIVESALRHDGDLQVRSHVHNARRRPNAWGISFGKESRESKRKVDSVAAIILARMARRAYLNLPKSKQRRKRSGKAEFF